MTKDTTKAAVVATDICFSTTGLIRFEDGVRARRGWSATMLVNSRLQSCPLEGREIEMSTGLLRGR